MHAIAAAYSEEDTCYPWTTAEILAPEDEHLPQLATAPAYVLFMETTVDEAKREYLATWRARCGLEFLSAGGQRLVTLMEIKGVQDLRTGQLGRDSRNPGPGA